MPSPSAPPAPPAPSPTTRVQGLPDPGEQVPALAWPTAMLYLGTLALFALEVLLFTQGVSPWVTVPMGAAVTFLMFSVMHEATHHAISTDSALNDLFGRISTPFVAAYSAYALFKFIHIEHHRNTNEAKAADPDAWTSEGPWWQLPFRWATLDLWYVVFYAGRMSKRPRREQVTVVATLVVFVLAVTAVALTGHLTTFVLLYLLPQRLGLIVLAWWFDYLPHHGLTVTQRENKYRATRIRVGGERFLTPLFVYQNYHLIHHLHPSVPFYRYVRAWRRNEQAYLDRDAAISTWFGRSLTPEEYRTWRRITDSVDPTSSQTSGRLAFHPLRVSHVEHLTEDSVALTFEVPQDLRSAYEFRAGQHLTLRARIDGVDVRRTYSISSPAGSGRLEVGIRRHEGGVFSSYATTDVEVGDILDVMTPTGSFADGVLDRAQHADEHLVAVAAGSGITPILSVVETALRQSWQGGITVVYGNRSADSAMYLDRLQRLSTQYADRLRIVHVHSRPVQADLQPRRIDPSVLDGLLEAAPNRSTTYVMCGPEALVEALAAHLSTREIPAARIRTELFGAAAPLGASTEQAPVDRLDVEARVTLDGQETVLQFDASGPTLLEAALDAGLDVPYSCAGGACGTCRGFLTRGEARMDQNHVLTPDEVTAGAVLACQLRPTSAEVALTFDTDPG